MRKGTVGLAVLAVVAASLSGCTAPSPQTQPTVSPASPSVPSTRNIQVDGPVGSDGLTVRRLAADGSIETVRVEDFPR